MAIKIGSADLMKIALWSPKGAGLHYGGPGMTAYRMYSSKTEKAFSLSLCHGSAEQAPYPLFASQTQIGSATSGRINQVKFIRAARHWIDENINRFDVFHGLQAFQMSVEPAWYADLLGSRTSKMLGIHRRRIKMIKELSGVIAISREIEQECLECDIDPNRIHRIPNGVDTKHFRPISNPKNRSELRQELGLKDIPTIVFSGGLVRRKRPHLLLDALHVLSTLGHVWQLVIVGPFHDADYLDSMEKFIAEKRLSEQVKLVGMTADVRPFLHAADIFALPSSKEGMPNAALEAMACGLPCVLTPVSGAFDLLIENGDCGVIVNPDGKSLANAFIDYDTDSTRCQDHASKARSKAIQQFDSSIVLNRTLQLFRSHIGTNLTGQLKCNLI